MEELIKYFEALEARIAALEKEQEDTKSKLFAIGSHVSEMVTILEELKNRPAPEPIVVEKPVTVEKPKVVEQPAPVAEPELAISVEPEPQPVEEEASPKAAIYGKSVEDIRQAISLGDRFLYQRELFGQNAELMQRTLTELNGLGSFDEAMNYITRFNWDTESHTYQQFIVTLHRRFG